MSWASMVWPVPVIAGPHATRQMLSIALNDEGEVLLQLPNGLAVLLPAASDEQLFEAIHDARELSRRVALGTDVRPYLRGDEGLK